MHSLASFVSHFNDFYGGINGTTFTGAIDVIVVEQPDGTFTCSPFHVRFGKLGILHSKEKIVDVTINDVPLDFHMKLGDSGEAFFVEKVDPIEEGDVTVPANLVTSPIPADEAKENLVQGFAIENVLKKELNPSTDKPDVAVEPLNDGLLTKQPKVFCAETSEVKLSKKISSFHGEFRPIDEMQVLVEKDSDSSIDSNVAEKTRRKKKTHLRKKSDGKMAKMKDDDTKIESSTDVESAVVDVDVHFFSDSEATPESENPSLRANTILSDSEVDRKSGDEGDVDRSWKWGELPAPALKSEELVEKAAATQPVEATSRRSMLGTMLSFMKKTKYLRNNPEVVTAEFKAEPNIPTTDDKPITDTEAKVETIASSPTQVEKQGEDDVESGCGVSLSQSPVVDNRTDEIVKSIALSLCGNVNSVKDEEFAKKLVAWEDLVKNHKLLEDPNLVVRFDGNYFNWKVACPLIVSVIAFNRVLPQSSVDALCLDYMPKKESPDTNYWWGWGRYVKKDATGDTDADVIQPAETSVVEIENKEVHRKVLRMTSEQISRLNLKPGQNEVVFSITSAYQGTAQCKCHIYRWRHDDRVVVSDIDGTITKSDVLGHILPILGRDWAQSGVAQLFTKIKKNGYQLLYLSARAIGQASTTRDYLKSIKQEELSLPEGPVLLSPTGLLNALHREVIDKRPEDFKIPCLKDIQSLFPEDCNPFYAGYGNKVNDVWSYRAVGIPMYRIFTVNPRGELKHEFTQTFQTTYSNLSYIVDHVFPAKNDKQQPDVYSSVVYWRAPMEDIVLDPITKKVLATIKTEAVTKPEE